MPLDFGNTCGDIDNQIEQAQQLLCDHVYNIIKDSSPMIPEAEVEKLAKDYATDIYSDLESIFEAVRELNTDMRKAADEQIDNLQDQIE